MQFLWTYIDDIVGKGANFWMLVEILFYLSMALVPTALPIAVLISSVMVMGNLAERYELSSFKSAGVPLLRVMQPLMFVTLAVSIFSFFCSNNIIPLANLKFKSRLYDIRKQKPTLSLEQGVFNDDFKGFIIHIGKKGSDNISIEDVLIYDHNSYNRDKSSMILADRGEMYTTADRRYFVMNLLDGTQYKETQPSGSGKDKTYPFIRTHFEQWTKVFDLREFEINQTDENLFKSHQTMLSTAQLRLAIDSLDERVALKDATFNRFLRNHFQFSKDSTTQNKQEAATKKTKKAISKPQLLPKDSAKQAAAQKRKKTHKGKRQKPVKQLIPDDWAEYESFLESIPPSQRSKYFNKAKSLARSIHGQAESTRRSLDRIGESRVKHIFELNLKFSMAAVCFIFLFIGAPMGAIVRKGGFGYPILIAIIFFMFYIVLNILCKKLAEGFVLHPVLASWTPCIILIPIGLTLTYRAMFDKKLLNVDSYTSFIRKWFKTN